jgi:hypothetical protein
MNDDHVCQGSDRHRGRESCMQIRQAVTGLTLVSRSRLSSLMFDSMRLRNESMSRMVTCIDGKELGVCG